MTTPESIYEQVRAQVQQVPGPEGQKLGVRLVRRRPALLALMQRLLGAPQNRTTEYSASARLPGIEKVAQRMDQADAGFLASVRERGFSHDEAVQIFRHDKKVRVIKRDAVNGTWNVKHGALWERDALHKALLAEDAEGGPAQQGTMEYSVENRRVTRNFQHYTSEQRADLMSSHRVGHRQRTAVGEYVYTHPDLPGVAYGKRHLAVKAALKLRSGDAAPAPEGPAPSTPCCDACAVSATAVQTTPSTPCCDACAVSATAAQTTPSTPCCDACAVATANGQATSCAVTAQAGAACAVPSPVLPSPAIALPPQAVPPLPGDHFRRLLPHVVLEIEQAEQKVAAADRITGGNWRTARRQADATIQLSYVKKLRAALEELAERADRDEIPPALRTTRTKSQLQVLFQTGAQNLTDEGRAAKVALEDLAKEHWERTERPKALLDRLWAVRSDVLWEASAEEPLLAGEDLDPAQLKRDLVSFFAEHRQGATWTTWREVLSAYAESRANATARVAAAEPDLPVPPFRSPAQIEAQLDEMEPRQAHKLVEEAHLHLSHVLGEVEAYPDKARALQPERERLVAIVQWGEQHPPQRYVDRVSKGVSKFQQVHGTGHLNRSGDKPAPTGKLTNAQVKEFIRRLGTNMDLDERPGELLYSTRENGDMSADGPGEDDFNEARRVAAALRSEFGSALSVTIEGVDEWVHLNVRIVDQ